MQLSRRQPTGSQMRAVRPLHRVNHPISTEHGDLLVDDLVAETLTIKRQQLEFLQSVIGQSHTVVAPIAQFPLWVICHVHAPSALALFCFVPLRRYWIILRTRADLNSLLCGYCLPILRQACLYNTTPQPPPPTSSPSLPPPPPQTACWTNPPRGVPPRGSCLLALRTAAPSAVSAVSATAPVLLPPTGAAVGSVGFGCREARCPGPKRQPRP